MHGALILGALIVVPVGVWFFALPWLVSAEKRRQARNVQAGVIGAGLDELFHPNARQARSQWQAQQELPAPAPVPGDRLYGEGRITIDLDR